jgi:hypothetical protein
MSKDRILIIFLVIINLTQLVLLEKYRQLIGEYRQYIRNHVKKLREPME